MRTFNNIANLMRLKRIVHPRNLSQSDLSTSLGYKNGQFISNVERGLCSVPLKMMKQVCEILNIDQAEMRAAILKDHEETLTNYFTKSSGARLPNINTKLVKYNDRAA